MLAVHKLIFLDFFSNNLLFLLNAFNYEKVPLVQRSIPFQDVITASRLLHAKISTEHGICRNDCAKLCLRTANCLSFNFCSPQTCVLNFADIFSDGVLVIQDTSCLYQGSRKIFFESFSNKNALDMLHSAINSKGPRFSPGKPR